MARGINKAVLIGNLGMDPEVRYTPNGNAVANVTLATSSVWRDKQSGELQERTEWHRIVFFNRLAEIVGEYLTKGAKIYVEGSLRTRKWQDKSGIERFTTEIIANEMQMLDSRTSKANDFSAQSQGQNFNKASVTNTGNTFSPSNNINGNVAEQQPAYPIDDNFDDDIPF